MKISSIPHPFPYQGSKRNIAAHILPFIPPNTFRVVEPFCGTAAISIACAANNIAKNFLLNDLNAPLISLWKCILNNPEKLLSEYEEHWVKQQNNSKDYFLKIRKQFNEEHHPHHLLYLLARIVKGSVRYNNNGEFNQSADNRRLGMKPELMRKNILTVSKIMKNKTTLFSQDFSDILAFTTPDDVIYLDPPYQGTSGKKDHRYLEGISFDCFVDVIKEMKRDNKMFIISYDGITGDKKHGKVLPKILNLKHLYINAGRSSQGTLLGKENITFESLYLSEVLLEKLRQKISQTDNIDLIDSLNVYRNPIYFNKFLQV